MGGGGTPQKATPAPPTRTMHDSQRREGACKGGSGRRAARMPVPVPCPCGSWAVVHVCVGGWGWECTCPFAHRCWFCPQGVRVSHAHTVKISKGVFAIRNTPKAAGEGQSAVVYNVREMNIGTHFPPFSPIFPHFSSDMWLTTPPQQPPRAREKWFFGVFAHRYPHFSTKNLQILTVGPIFPHFSYLEQFSGGITRSLPAAGN